MKGKIKKHAGIWCIEVVTPSNVSIRMWRYKEGWTLFISHSVYFKYPVIHLQYGGYAAEKVREELPTILEKMDKMIAISGVTNERQDN